MVPGPLWMGLALEPMVIGLGPGSSRAGLDRGSTGPVKTQGPLGWAWNLDLLLSPSPMGRVSLCVLGCQGLGRGYENNVNLSFLPP